MFRNSFLTGLLFFSLQSFAQETDVQTEAERKADSIMQMFRGAEKNSEPNELGIDTAELEKAEERYMNRFLNLQRDQEKEKLQKTFLYVSIGAVMLGVLIIGFRRKRN